MSTFPTNDLPPEDMIERAKWMLEKAESVLATPVLDRPDMQLVFRPLTRTLRDFLEYHEGYRDNLPQLLTLVSELFETLSEFAPGRWQIKRFEVTEFQRRVDRLAAFLRQHLNDDEKSLH